MFRKIDQRENVYRYQLSGAGALVVDMQHNLFLERNLIAEGVEPTINTVYADQYLVYLMSTGQTVVRDLRRTQFAEADIVPLLETIADGTIIGSANMQIEQDRVTGDYAVYEFPSLALRHKLPMRETGQAYRSGKYWLYSSLRGAVHCLNLESQELVWRIEMGGIKKMLGVVDGVFWLEGQLTATHSVLRGFDLATGAPVDLSEKVELPAQPIVSLTPDGRSVFIVGRGAAFEHAAYVEIDLATRAVKRRGGLTSAILPDVTLALYEYTLVGDLLYGTAGLNGSFWPTALCVLNYQTLKTEWWQPIDSVPDAFLGAGHAPQVQGNDLFILDTKGFLHQYQRL